MDQIKEIFTNLSSDDLAQGVIEIFDKNNNGCYEEGGILRNIQQQIRVIINNNDYPIEMIEKAVTWEISRRWYNKREDAIYMDK